MLEIPKSSNYNNTDLDIKAMQNILIKRVDSFEGYRKSKQNMF